MDLLAAFFFSTFIIKQLQSLVSKETSRESSLKVFWKSALVGGGILSVVYVGLVLLGSLYSSELTGIAHPDLLGFIAVKTLGSLGAPVLCAVVILACLTTAVVLASLFAEFSYKSLLKEKISEKKALIGTLLIGFLVSTFGFSAIASFIAPILEVIYPALIVLTVINILHKLLGLQVLNLASLVERGFGKRKD